MKLSIAKNEFTARWDFANLQEEENCLISNILDKCNINEVQVGISKLNLWHVNQLLDNEQKRMITWRQLKVREEKRHVGKKAKWFKVIEDEILVDKESRDVKEEYSRGKRFQVQETEKKISLDKRKKEWVLIKSKENRGSEFGRIIRKEKNAVEVEIWKEDSENTLQECSQQRAYNEGYKLRKDNQKQRITLKEVHNISSYIRKKDNTPQVTFNREYLEKIRKETKKSKVEEFKKFKNLECIEVENSWEAELINQIIQNTEVRKELKDRLEANKREKEIVFYTDGSLGREGTRDKLIMGYSIIQIDSINNVVFRYKGRIEN